VQISYLTRRYAVAPLVKNTRSSGLEVLKGDQISAKGFNPGLGNSRRSALKGHHNPAHHIGSKSFARVSSFSRHFQGAFLRGGYPGLKPWLSSFAPSGRRTLYPSLMLTRMCSAGRTGSASYKR
jgi:hypothetical protein